METASRPSREPVTQGSVASGQDGGARVGPLAPPSPTAPHKVGELPGADAPQSPPAAGPVMDRDFIERNQIIERYLAGKLPIRGATEFERYCKAHPELLDAIGLPDHVNAALRLIDASGQPQPWELKPKRFWESPWLLIGLAVTVLVLAWATFSLVRGRSVANRTITALKTEIARQPLDPPTQTRMIRLLPSTAGPSSSPVVVLGANGQTQLDELALDLSRSPYRKYRVTIDRIGQGRVAIINNLAKDSNGHLNIAINSSALGPGDYRFIIEGLTWRGRPVPDSWVTVEIDH